jgi:hypothetical protein
MERVSWFCLLLSMPTHVAGIIGMYPTPRPFLPIKLIVSGTVSQGRKAEWQGVA